MPVAAPMSARGLWLNAYYKNDSEIVVAIADALKEEYKAIVDAGFILQLDDAYLAHESIGCSARWTRARSTNMPSAA